MLFSDAEGQILNRKKAAISDITLGMSGMLITRDHLFTLLSYLNMRIMNVPRLIIPSVNQQINVNGKLELTTSAPYLIKEADAFIDFIKRNK